MKIKVGKGYKSVLEMVKDTIEDKEFVKDFERHTRARNVVRGLLAKRLASGLSQKDLAARLGCTQSRVSKLETSHDADLSLGDLARYASALEIPVALLLTSQGWELIEGDAMDAKKKTCSIQFSGGKVDLVREVIEKTTSAQPTANKEISNGIAGKRQSKKKRK